MTRTTKVDRATHDVVVGVDGTPASVNAVRYARAEAARSGGTVTIVHVVPDYVPGLHPLRPNDLTAAGRSVLDSVLERAGATKDDPVATQVLQGPVVSTLADAGRRALTVVVGSDRRPTSMRLLTGNVSTGVAARCSAPVVSVPETWHADHAGVILVGVKHPDRSEALLAQAFDLARGRGSRLIVLHAWQFPHAYDDNLPSDREALSRWQERKLLELEEMVVPWRERCPSVEVELRSVRGQAAHALVTSSAGADELVIVRRAHGVPAAAHLGSTARTVLLYAHCPVRVVPAAGVRDPRDEDREEAGGKVKQASA